ncbi:MAG: hypothetical protein K2N94_03845 [Lachnospiraceae bacterium]|nr:hypothetical protein [Lachnospiraceae bacterium]
MKRRLYTGILLLTFAIIIPVCIIWYKKPKEYFVSENVIEMCDETGENLIEVMYELYLHRYFFKASEVHGNIYMNGTKYTSLFDLEQFASLAKGFSNENDFAEKLRGKEYTVPFVNEDYWNERRANGMLGKLIHGEECIDYLVVYPEEKVIMFSFFGRKEDMTLYIGPAENAVEYEESMRKVINLYQEQ